MLGRRSGLADPFCRFGALAGLIGGFSELQCYSKLEEEACATRIRTVYGDIPTVDEAPFLVLESYLICGGAVLVAAMDFPVLL